MFAARLNFLEIKSKDKDFKTMTVKDFNTVLAEIIEF